MRQRTLKSAWLYFFLTIAFSLPFWLLGALSGLQLLPALPLSSLAVVCPLAAAAMLSYREKGPNGVKDLLKRSFYLGRAESKAWYLPTILLMPLTSLAAYGAMRLTGTPLPSLQVPIVRTLGLFLVFIVAGLCEELGWSGYAIDPLQDRFGALAAALVIGVVWAVWHFVPLAEAHRSLEFVMWWTLNTIALRVIIVWLYNNTNRSVFAAALVHAMSDLAWQVFPVNGSLYDPRFSGPILALVGILVIVVWGPKTFPKRSR